ncbi:MAG: 3-isopropylmalate dehydratase small subunit [Candidatus Dadabacteria bacterium]|nr:3-isopropylmalate dehydratase small subunit [Candidatus Dadabacteria bacterium]
MEKLQKVMGKVAALDRMNVDTDQIIPKQFLKRIERTGFGEFLFFDWKYNDDGTINEDFELNQTRYAGSCILLTRDNFGSGSSREHAPWAIREAGFRVILAPSFADIFYNNCFKNSILPIVISKDRTDELFCLVLKNEGYSLEIDLVKRSVTGQGVEFSFEIDDFKRKVLLEGLDDISQTLELEATIENYEKLFKNERQWVLPDECKNS